MDADRQAVSSRGRVVWLVLLVAWALAAAVAFAILVSARGDLSNVLRGMEPSYLRGVLRGWAVSLKLCERLLVFLLLLALWAAVLLFRRQPHPRQWATILVFTVLAAGGWVLFAGFGAPLAEARAYLAPGGPYAAQLSVFTGAALLFVLGLVRIRRAPEPVEPQQDRYHIANYAQANKPGPGTGSAALSEARARAESVLPVDDEEG